MKKTIFLAVVLSAFAFSCSKDYTCECIYSSSADSYASKRTASRTLVKNAKSQAKANCASTSVTNTKTGNTYKTDCTLK